MAPSFDAATKITQTGSHTYAADFPDEWCVGTVPNGGFITSCFMRVVSLHFATTLSKQKQPQTLALHLEFMRRTQQGPAKFVVKEMKLGRQASVVHVSLYQDDREEVVGYLSQSDIAAEQGPSFDTEWSLHPSSSPVGLSKLDADNDANWFERKDMPFGKIRKSSRRLRWFFPKSGQPSKSISDQWVCWADGSNFTQEALGFVCDNFPLVVESYVRKRPYDIDQTNSEEEEKKQRSAAAFWYPTLLLNLEVKKVLPAEGVKFLFVRAQSKQIKNGRLDIEVTIMDDKGDLVALSHHVVLVVDVERNRAARRKPDQRL